MPLKLLGRKLHQRFYSEINIQWNNPSKSFEETQKELKKKYHQSLSSISTTPTLFESRKSHLFQSKLLGIIYVRKNQNQVLKFMKSEFLKSLKVLEIDQFSKESLIFSEGIHWPSLEDFDCAQYHLNSSHSLISDFSFNEKSSMNLLKFIHHLLCHCQVQNYRFIHDFFKTFHYFTDSSTLLRLLILVYLNYFNQLHSLVETHLQHSEAPEHLHQALFNDMEKYQEKLGLTLLLFHFWFEMNFQYLMDNFELIKLFKLFFQFNLNSYDLIDVTRVDEFDRAIPLFDLLQNCSDEFFHLIILYTNQKFQKHNLTPFPLPVNDKDLLTHHDYYHYFLNHQHQPHQRNLVKRFSLFNRKKNLFLMIDMKNLANQLTLIEFQIFQRIQLKEFLHQNWSNNILKFLESPNLTYSIQWFNRVAYWVAHTILKENKRSKRVQTIQQFISLAKELFDLNNFNGLFEIMAGLSLSSVQRLKKSWKSIQIHSKQVYQQLLDFLNSQQNYYHYRKSLDKFSNFSSELFASQQPFTSLTPSLQPIQHFLKSFQLYHHPNAPFLPYLGLHLKDLALAESGNDVFLDKFDLTNQTTLTSPASTPVSAHSFSSPYHSHFHNPTLLNIPLVHIGKFQLLSKLLFFIEMAQKSKFLILEDLILQNWLQKQLFQIFTMDNFLQLTSQPDSNHLNFQPPFSHFNQSTKVFSTVDELENWFYQLSHHIEPPSFDS